MVNPPYMMFFPLTMGLQCTKNDDENIVYAEEAQLVSARLVAHRSSGHAHTGEERCPYCDQPIPNERAAEIRARLDAENQKRVKTLTQQLGQQFAVEKDCAVTMAREEAKTAAEAAWAAKFAETEGAKVAAQAQYEELKSRHDDIINQRIQEVRETFENDKQVQINANNIKHFEEIQRLSVLVGDLQRKLEKKTNEELGEGAEIDLFESLKAEFEDDRIERVGKGKPGADIKHVVMHNGRECGAIIYDSKNRNAWRSEYVEKLGRDQRAEKADHAILASLKFPADTRQLHIEDGVIIANPARVIAVVHLLRRYMVQVSTLRLSNTDRVKKTADMYDLITSKRFEDQMAAIDTHSGDLLALQEKEKRAHEATWKHQGALVRSIQKVRADLTAEIDGIVEAD